MGIGARCICGGRAGRWACRAMLLVLLLPDPCDSNYSADFKEKARRRLLGIYNQATEAGNEELRGALLKFIGDASPMKSLLSLPAPRPWTGCTSRCCSKPPASPTPCARCSRRNRSVAKTSCAWPTLSPPSTPATARKNGWWMLCSWRCLSEAEVMKAKPKRSLRQAGLQNAAPTKARPKDAATGANPKLTALKRRSFHQEIPRCPYFRGDWDARKV